MFVLRLLCCFHYTNYCSTLTPRTIYAWEWHCNERDGVPNHQPHDCLLYRSFRCRPKKISKLRVPGLCAGNSPVTGEFLAQMASNAEKVSIWWRHHGLTCIYETNMGTLLVHGLLARNVKLWVAHAPGMPGTFPRHCRFSDPDMHHSKYVTHVPWCMPGSLTSGFSRCRWRGKRSQHLRSMRNGQFYISGKWAMYLTWVTPFYHLSSERIIRI